MDSSIFACLRYNDGCQEAGHPLLKSSLILEVDLSVMKFSFVRVRWRRSSGPVIESEFGGSTYKSFFSQDTLTNDMLSWAFRISSGLHQYVLSYIFVQTGTPLRHHLPSEQDHNTSDRYPPSHRSLINRHACSATIQVHILKSSSHRHIWHRNSNRTALYDQE